MKYYETDRLTLRPAAILDASFYLKLLNTPKWLRNIGDRNVKSIKDAEVYITEKMIPQLERLGYSNYTVIRKSDNIKIGCCGLYDREGIEGVDIGFAFLPEFEKKGYAYESASKMKELGISEFGIKKISAITIPENKSSQKLLEKLDFTFIKMMKIPNDDEDLMLYEYQTNV
ncbi:Protein N-acetyltransferase, RimJ/RimL family [Aquimarina amphilecti]|uniref:Protein N-acetyltransferase, RimJ/RimL family n=1 Tax=Aquimarina amphilecti TaxID=1038014 RepID=A0A1H7JA96_AQUAM|nr:GNAT family N-acetyltransferase [Aquimarina amphilecti]SEK71456.1 Protein N-acetyltransferase, RimJ/RimL family [Aquimarina amphilecti]